MDFEHKVVAHLLLTILKFRQHSLNAIAQTCESQQQQPRPSSCFAHFAKDLEHTRSRPHVLRARKCESRLLCMLLLYQVLTGHVCRCLQTKPIVIAPQRVPMLIELRRRAQMFPSQDLLAHKKVSNFMQPLCP